MRTQAERDVRGAMLLEKVGEAENVDVSKAEVDEEIGKMAEYYRSTPQQINESLGKQGGTGVIENNLRTRRSIEAVIAHAKITDGPWVDDKTEEKEEKPDKPKKLSAKKKAPAKKSAKSGE